MDKRGSNSCVLEGINLGIEGDKDKWSDKRCFFIISILLLYKDDFIDLLLEK